MDFTQEQNTQPNYIRQYAPNKNFLVDQQNYYSSIAIYKNKIIENWIENNNIKNLNINNLQEFLNYKPEIFILGTGETQIFPNSDFLQNLANNKIACEVMSTNSACKTFNILQQENRNVFAALIL